MKLEGDRKIIFAHMMKTAGTSLTKKFAEHFGPDLYIARGGLSLLENSTQASQQIPSNVCAIAGHTLRPFMDDYYNDSLSDWITFFREPKSRFISHFFYDLNRTKGFSYPKYKAMKNLSIQEWEKIESTRNYQTRFIAGKDDVDEAIRIIESRLSWVGLCEEFEESLVSLAFHFGLSGFNYSSTRSNVRRPVPPEIDVAIDEEYVIEANNNDLLLYEYVRNDVWPKYKCKFPVADLRKPRNSVARKMNEFRFLYARLMNNDQTKINTKNISRFVGRWFT